MKNWFDNKLHIIRKYYPPFRNWHFWTVQLLAIPIALLHFVVVNAGYFAHFQGLYFIPITLLVIPVVYAAMTFGFAGSIGTAVWVVILSIPNLIFGLAGFERLGEIFQLIILVTLAIFIGQKVDRENVSRKKIESANSALSASEKKYRELFDSSPFPILILNSSKIILDTNPAASLLLNKSAEDLKGMSVNMLGIRNATKPISPNQIDKWWESNLATITKKGSEIFLEPTYTTVNDSRGNVTIQLLLRDVTEEHQRQVGLKAYTAYMLRAQEEERQRIARELHDETIQTLALLCRQLDNIDQSGDDHSTSVSVKLEEARNIAEKAVSDLRDFTRGLRPPILDDLGVVASIRRLLVDFLDRSKIKGQFKLNGTEKRLSRDVEVGIYRIAQEALWNIEHHAKAANVIMSITFNDRETILEVTDDGIGFNVPAVLRISSRNSQLGLVGMQERAASFGGELKIKSQPGNGTTVKVTIPNLKYISEDQIADESYWPLI